MDIHEHNRRSWNAASEEGESPWVQPFDSERIARARAGDWEVVLTPIRSVPKEWFGPSLAERDLLCLASGGGQQAPLLSAAGARVVSFDQSEGQLAKDRLVAEREGLELRLEQGRMDDLSRFECGSFDLIFHPVSNVFAPEVRPVWLECERVLRPGGRLLSGFMNPAYFLFDHQALEKGEEAVIRYPLPYSDIEHAPQALRERMVREKEAFEYSHSLEDQIGGQLAAGLEIAGFYEDGWSDSATPLNRYFKAFLATLARKPGGPL